MRSRRFTQPACFKLIAPTDGIDGASAGSAVDSIGWSNKFEASGLCEPATPHESSSFSNSLDSPRPLIQARTRHPFEHEGFAAVHRRTLTIMSDQGAQSDPDVLIIGAGPTGAVAAKRFAEAGMRVVVLEQGDWPDYSKARANHPDFELTLGRHWSGNPNRRQAPADYPIDDRDSDIAPVLYNAVGGGTVIYAAHWQRNVPSDFRVRTLDGVGDDWPLTYEDLAPYYERVEADFAVSGLAGATALPPA